MKKARKRKQKPTWASLATATRLLECIVSEAERMTSGNWQHHRGGILAYAEAAQRRIGAKR